jgi:hypothetical protein
MLTAIERAIACNASSSISEEPLRTVSVEAIFCEREISFLLMLSSADYAQSGRKCSVRLTRSSVPCSRSVASRSRAWSSSLEGSVNNRDSPANAGQRPHLGEAG